MNTKSIVVFLLCSFSALIVQAELYDYKKLRQLNFDVMKSKVSQKVTKARGLIAKNDKVAGIEVLRDALKMILSRPNDGGFNMTERLLPIVREPLEGLGSFPRSVEGVIKSAIRIYNREASPVKYRATSLIVFKNFVAEFAPEAKKGPLRKIYKMMATTKFVEAGSKLTNHLNRYGMMAAFDPAGLAANALKR